MIKRINYYDGVSQPPSRLSSGSNADAGHVIESKRKANIYDAVAGRVTQAGLVGNFSDIKSSKQPLRPDEVLFKQTAAPVRYEETDYYHAHASLPTRLQLPSGDLLNALHIYISKLYSQSAQPASQKLWKCMDETALIAFGILMEEMARKLLGETGDLAFTEAATEEKEQILTERQGNADGEDSAHFRSKVRTVREQRAGSWSSSSDDSQYAIEQSD